MNGGGGVFKCPQWFVFLAQCFEEKNKIFSQDFRHLVIGFFCTSLIITRILGKHSPNPSLPFFSKNKQIQPPHLKMLM